MKETHFDGSRSGKNFTIDRQVEPLVMDSEVSGLENRHAFLKLGNSVARFHFEYMDVPQTTPGFVPRKVEDDELPCCAEYRLGGCHTRPSARSNPLSCRDRGRRRRGT